MVCGAPTSCSSGGRSAVTTISGTLAWCGLDDGRVQLDRGGAARGQHDGRAARGHAEAERHERRRPARRGGRGPAARSSAASASAIGRRARPGGDDGVGDAAPHPLVDERRAERRRHGGRHGRSLRGTASGPGPEQTAWAGSVGGVPAPALATETTGSGDRVVLLHGFTQTGRCWGPLADGLARDHAVRTVDLPGHGGSATIDAGIEASVPLARRRGRDGRLPRLLDGRALRAAAGPRPARRRHAPRAHRRLPRAGRRRRACRPPRGRRRARRRGSRRSASRRSCTSGSTCRCSGASTRPCATRPSGAPTPRRAWRRASDEPGPVPRNRSGIASASSRCPCCSSPAATIPSSAPSPRRWPRSSRTSSTPPSPTRATPCTSSTPPRPPPSCADWLDRTAR